MPADYQSTARALALPPSPEEPSSPSFEPIRAPWSHGRSGSIGGRRPPATGVAGLRDTTIGQFQKRYRQLNKMFSKMTPVQRVLAVVGGICAAALGITFMILTGKIFTWLKPVAEKWEKSPLVFFLLWLGVFMVSFPPLVGWSTLGTISGFIFGIWKGWVLFSTATVVGSFCSFVVSRTLLSGFVNRMVEKDKRFAAIALTLKYDGLKLLCMIRLCPLPYSYCNGAISTFPTVSAVNYALATAIITPKHFIAAFIGSRLRVLSENGEEMSAGSKAVNLISIIVSMVVAIGTGIYIYKRTVARAQQLEAEERANIRHSLQDDHAHHRPHGAFSDDPEANAAAQTLAQDEEERLDFVDADDDHVAIENVGETYHDEFTDNDSDIFDQGDGDDDEAYTLHRHVSPKANAP